MKVLLNPNVLDLEICRTWVLQQLLQIHGSPVAPPVLAGVPLNAADGSGRFLVPQGLESLVGPLCHHLALFLSYLRF